MAAKDYGEPGVWRRPELRRRSRVSGGQAIGGQGFGNQRVWRPELRRRTRLRRATAELRRPRLCSGQGLGGQSFGNQGYGGGMDSGGYRESDYSRRGGMQGGGFGSEYGSSGNGSTSAPVLGAGPPRPGKARARGAGRRVGSARTIATKTTLRAAVQHAAHRLAAR
jgi:hypothetical protein